MSAHVLDSLKKDFNELKKSPLVKWNDVKKENNGGVYIIHHKNRAIYVGSTNHFNVRFIDMLYESTHTLYNKVYNKFNNKEKVKNFLKEKCMYKIKIENNLRKRELLEHFVIVILNPKHNK